jgi:hypothetical protein
LKICDINRLGISIFLERIRVHAPNGSRWCASARMTGQTPAPPRADDYESAMMNRSAS